ncbi:VirB6/TrbL-like conjugal transfer protein, CD1112 family [Youxingia wuxianensis]
MNFYCWLKWAETKCLAFAGIYQCPQCERIAVYLVTHTFTITMAVFDMAQHVVSDAAGVIGGDTNIDVDAALSSMQAGLDAMEIPELLLLVMETSLVW